MRPALLCLLTASLAAADAAVSGQILDSENRDGGVIDFPILRLKSPDDMDGEPVPIKTDRMGRFTVKLAPGSYRIGDIRRPTAKDPRLYEGNFNRDAFDVGGDPMYDLGILRLERTGTYVTGRVTRSGKPVAAGTKVELFVRGAGVPGEAGATTAEGGVYELQLPDVRARQRVAVRVEEAGGSAFGSAEVDLWKPGTADIALPEKYHDLLLDLTTSGETWIYLHPAGDPAPYFMHKGTKTAKVSVPGLAPGAWVVTAVADGAQVNVAVAVPSEQPAAVALPAAARHRLEGRVTLSGLPKDRELPELAVIARPAGDGPGGYLWTPLRRDGGFAFAGLAAGKYEITLASGKSFEAMRYFDVQRSVMLQSVLELAAPRTLELKASAADVLE